MKKIFMFCSLLVCSLLFLLSGCGNTQTAADTPKPYKIGVLRIDDSLPLYLAEKEQLFKKAGVPVKIIEFNSAIDQRKAMEAGELDGMMTDMIVTGLLKKAVMTYVSLPPPWEPTRRKDDSLSCPHRTVP